MVLFLMDRRNDFASMADGLGLNLVLGLGLTLECGQGQHFIVSL